MTMYEELRGALRATNESPVFWAMLALGMIVIGAVSGFWVIAVIAALPAWQWGYRAGCEIYEKGIMCAECADRLDGPDDLRNDPDSPYGLTA
jgi:hypothetical protein